MSGVQVDFSGDFQEVFRVNTPHLGQLTGLAVSPDGNWLLSSSNNLGRRLFLKSSTRDGRSHGTVDMGDNAILSIAWADSDHVFLGCNDGQLYYGRFQVGEVGAAMVLADSDSSRPC